MIKVENLNYTYQKGTPNERQALFDINLEIKDASLTAVIGHTGSGKSTLVQLLDGLIKPDSGKIYINGNDITSRKADLKALRKKVGIVFQYPEHQLFEETVYNDIAFGPRNMGLYKEEIDKRVKMAMTLTGLDEECAQKSPFELSGGQKRLAAIAGVIAMQPEILIMDEPAAGLDPAGRKQIFEMIKRLHKEISGMTVVFVSHSMEDAAEISEDIVVMSEGKIAMRGTSAQVFSEGEELREMGLDIPQAAMLIQSLIKKGYPLKNDIYTVDGAVAEIIRLSHIIGDKNV